MNSLKQIGSEPALLLRRGKEKVVAVGDLHIGWEVTLAQQGIHVPSQTGKMLQRLRTILEKEQPSRLIMLGDVKHSVTGAELEEWRDVPEFFEELVKLVAHAHKRRAHVEDKTVGLDLIEPSAGPVILFKHRHPVSQAGQSKRGRKPSQAGTDDYDMAHQQTILK